MKETNDLVRNTIILSIGTILAKGLQFIMLPFLSRWMSTEAYGQFDLLVTYVTLLLPVITLATGEAVFRFTVSCESKEEQKPFVTNGFLFTTVNLLICMCVICGLSYFGILSKRLLLYFFALLITQLYNHFLQAFLRGIKRLTIYTVSNIVNAIVTAVSTVLFVNILKQGLEGLLLAYTVGYCFADFVIIVTSEFGSFLSLKMLSAKILKQLIKYSFPLVPNDISWWVLNVSDRQMIAIFLGASANGIYAMANKIPGLCTVIFSMFNISWQQSIVSKVGKEDWKEYANLIFNRMLVFLLTLCSGILSVVFILFQYIFDSKYRSGMTYVPILVTAVIFSSLMLFYGGIQIALKLTAENGITTVIGAIVNLTVDILLIRAIGLYAAAVSTLVANMVTAFCRNYRLKSIVSFYPQKETCFCVVFYLYISISYYYLSTFSFFSCFNIMFAGCVFLWMNRELIVKLIKK